MKKLRTAALTVALTLAFAGTGGGAAAATSLDRLAACEAAVSAKTDVAASLVTDACTYWTTGPASDQGSVPTLVTGWTAIGGLAGDESGTAAGWPIVATCLLVGVITGPTTAYYVLVGAAVTAGPGTATRLSCSAPNAGLSFTQTVPGVASAGVDASTSLFPGSPSGSQTVCAKGEAWYSLSPTYSSTGGILGSCSPRLAS